MPLNELFWWILVFGSLTACAVCLAVLAVGGRRDTLPRQAERKAVLERQQVVRLRNRRRNRN